MKRVWQAWDVTVALVVTVFALWVMGNALAAISQGPVERGECDYYSACD